jgi:hypothetical protein
VLRQLLQRKARILYQDQRNTYAPYFGCGIPSNQGGGSTLLLYFRQVIMAIKFFACQGHKQIARSDSPAIGTYGRERNVLTGRFRM